MNGFACEHCSTDDRRPIRCDRMTPHVFDVLRREAVAGNAR